MDRHDIKNNRYHPAKMALAEPRGHGRVRKHLDTITIPGNIKAHGLGVKVDTPHGIILPITPGCRENAFSFFTIEPYRNTFFVSHQIIGKRHDA